MINSLKFNTGPSISVHWFIPLVYHVRVAAHRNGVYPLGLCTPFAAVSSLSGAHRDALHYTTLAVVFISFSVLHIFEYFCSTLPLIAF